MISKSPFSRFLFLSGRRHCWGSYAFKIKASLMLLKGFIRKDASLHPSKLFYASTLSKLLHNKTETRRVSSHTNSDSIGWILSISNLFATWDQNAGKKVCFLWNILTTNNATEKVKDLIREVKTFGAHKKAFWFRPA